MRLKLRWIGSNLSKKRSATVVADLFLLNFKRQYGTFKSVGGCINRDLAVTFAKLYCRAHAPRPHAEALLPKVTAMLDKLTKHNIIHKNKAANLKGAIQLHVNAL